jgi:hypothetical protein
MRVAETAEADAWASEVVRKIADAERMGGGFRLYFETAVREIAMIRRERDQLRSACARVCQETDWCPACERHPSHGHREICPLVKELRP